VWKVVRVDAGTGRATRTRRITSADSGFKLGPPDLLSTSPLIVVANNNDFVDGEDAYLVFDDAWNLRSRIPTGKPRTAHSLLLASPGLGTLPGAYHLDRAAVVADDRLVTVTVPKQGSENTLLAYDLNSGKRLWSATVPGKRIMTPVAVEGASVVVALAPPDDRKASDGAEQGMARVSLAAGKVGGVVSTQVHVRGGGPVFIELYGYAYADNRLYAVNAEGSSNFPEAFTIG
jgi:outer membrane protein assembly factor BamB